MFDTVPRSWPDQEHLGVLACRFRSTRDVAQRKAIAREYAETVTRLIESSNWHEAPSPEDWLPYEWMPAEFFAFWSSPEDPTDRGTSAVPHHPPNTCSDPDYLGVLAMRFRSNRDRAERAAIAREYAETVKCLIKSGNWHEAPSPEDWLPYDWMPREFFAFWSSPEEPPNHSTVD